MKHTTNKDNQESDQYPIMQPSSQQSSSQQSSQLQERQQAVIQEQMKRIKEQLKSVSYELILKQKDALEQSKSVVNKNGKTKKIEKKKKKHVQLRQQKHQKNEAVEVSIYKKPKKQHQLIFTQKRKKGIDPRYQSYAGHYNQDLAMKSYGFIPKLQQAEIQELKSKLKSNVKRHKLTSHEREVLANEYNVITNSYKQGQLLSLQKQTKAQLKQKHGPNYYISKKEFDQQFQRKKLENMNEADRDKKLKEKRTKMMRGQLHERRKVLHFKTS